MRLRNAADRRVLVWALLLFPAVPALGYARPDLVLWLVPAALYLGYCAGVVTHYHNHSPVFEGAASNRAYGAWLSVFYGYPIFAWIPTHNQNHHRYVNGPKDATRTYRYSDKDSLYNLITYPIRSALWQAEGIRTYVAWAKASAPDRYRDVIVQRVAVIVGHGALVALAIALRGAAQGLLVYGLLVGLPALFASWSMMFTNYVQHVGCDYDSPDNHSRNFVSPVQNWFVFDAGFHTVHHEKPGAHWSLYRAMHRERAAAIDPSLNANSIFGFVFRRYFVDRVRSLLRRASPARG